MAELASGAVSSLLSVIRNETQLLGGVQSDVQFIKEEMESMNSFLAQLARSAPPSGEHDEQVRTWMNQVRLLAQDCNNCIDLYLYRGNPDVQRARGRIRRYLWWAYWFLHKLLAQHQAAIQLRELKERARHVGERRLRYGVEVPEKSAGAAGRPTLAALAAAGDEEEEDGDDQPTATHRHPGRRAYFEPPTLDRYVQMKLSDWGNNLIPAGAMETFSIAILAPDRTCQDVLQLASETLVFQPDWDLYRPGYDCTVTVDISAVHPPFLELGPQEVLYYILRELPNSVSQKQGAYPLERKDKNFDSLEVRERRFKIYVEKEQDFDRVKESIKDMKVYDKLIKIRKDIQDRENKGKLKQELKQNKDGERGLEGLLQLCFLPSRALSQEGPFNNEEALDDHSITKLAMMLKGRMEEDENVMQLKGQGGGADDEGPKQGGGGGGSGGEEQKEPGVEDGDGEGQKEEAVGGGDKDGDEQKEETAGGGGEIQKEEAGAATRGGERQEEDDHGKRQTFLIHLHLDQYKRILRKVFPEITNSMNQQQGTSMTKQATKKSLDEDQVNQIIHKAKQEILLELKEGKYDKDQATSKGRYEINQETGEGRYNNNRETSQSHTPDQYRDKYFKQIDQKMNRMQEEFEEQFKIKWLVDEIKHHLKENSPLPWETYKCPLFILKPDRVMEVSRWEDTRNALSWLGLSADVLIVDTTKDTQQAKQYCHPPVEPIDYSLVGLYHYTVLQCTSHLSNEPYYNPQIFRDILNECEPHDFCMRIFTHALYCNPKRSSEELIKLHKNLHDSPKSFDIIAKKMFKFSYSDLPKEYKSCLLYLAIFPRGHIMKRSTLIGRWVAEGLVFKEDWLSSVSQANRCFDTLINRWLVYPADIGAKGKVKSCVVGDIVHGFITKIARKQHIVEPRLSHHLARHFSIFNDLHLRSSERIQNFFQRLSRPQVSQLKVLDLEGCKCFGGNNRRYLKEICRKMLLLKYLSLRGTDITQLPREINHLHELEFLDIQQTEVPECATRHVLLLKLKHLLAGHIDTNPSSSDNAVVISTNDKSVSTVQIPHSIGKMVNLEVLSNVKAQNSHDLKDIGKLCYLRKLGVVIYDNNSHLRRLLQEISDLHECLHSLSITTTQDSTHSSGLHQWLRSLPTNCTQNSTHPKEELNKDIADLKNYPKHLESLSLRGKSTILSLFAKPGNAKLAKVTLSRTLVNQDNLIDLARLPNLQCVRLRRIRIDCPDRRLTIKKDGFDCLKYLLVEGSNLTEIIFEEGAVRELEEMVLSFNNDMGSVSGAFGLQKLQELELNNNNNNGRLLSSFEDTKPLAKLTLRGIFLDEGAISCERNQITFTKDKFPKLEKIVWFGSSLASLSGIKNLPKFKELEFNGDIVPNKVKEELKEHKNRPTLKHNIPKI